MSVDLDLVGRVVLVTGGVRGVGLGVARAFHDAGAVVVVCSRRVPQDPRSELHPDMQHVVCDVRDPEAVESLVEGIVERHGRFDVLVNNAGGAPYALAADASAGFHEKVVGLNLLSPLLVSQAANNVM